MKQTTCLAEYQSPGGKKRRLDAEKTPHGWNCKFRGFGLGRNTRAYRAYTPEGVALLAHLYVAGWSGTWRAVSTNFPEPRS